jgi:hypothetical protein
LRLQTAHLRIALPLLCLAAGCNDPHVVGLAGIWDGGPEILEPTNGIRKEWQYKGFLQIYATGNKFKLRQESSGQIVEAEGVWAMSKDDKKLTLEFKKVTFDDLGGQLRRAPGVEPIDPVSVRKAYSGKMLFNLNRQTQTLSGLEMEFGPLVVKHVFRKGEG